MKDEEDVKDKNKGLKRGRKKEKVTKRKRRHTHIRILKAYSLPLSDRTNTSRQ